MKTVQQLYDEAFKLWENSEHDKARQIIYQALELAPNDLSLHALAIHSYNDRKPKNDFKEVPHLEFIIDQDIHYKDTLDKYGDTHHFLEMLLSNYHLMLIYAEEDDHSYLQTEVEINSADIKEKLYRYTHKILEAGYGIYRLYDLFNLLRKTEKWDEIISLSYYIIKEKSAEDLGLPGLENCEKDGGWMENDISQIVMDAFFYSGRNTEALAWCQKYLEIYPDDWIAEEYMGEILTRLNRPADAAKQWVISLLKNEDPERFRQMMEDFCFMVADEGFYEKYMLWHRLHDMKDKIPPEKKGIFDKLSSEAFFAARDHKKKVVSDNYIESMLDMKLPPLEKKHYFYFDRIWIPKIMGPHPYLPTDKDILTDQGTENTVIPKTRSIKPETIEKFGIDLTARTEEGKFPPVVGRDKEIDALIRILIRMEKNNPVLLGEAGVGKTAIITGLAQRIKSDKVPVFLKDKRIIELPMSSLVGGTMWRGDFEQRIINIIKELRENKDIILFVDELHTIMGAGAGSRNDMDVANIIKPALAKGEIRLVGATTHREYTLYIEKDQAMARRFTPVRVTEMDRDATLVVLKNRVAFWREHHSVEVDEEILKFAIDLTEHHVKNRRFPDKAIDLLDESCAFVRTTNINKEDGILHLEKRHVEHVFREWTGASPEQNSVSKDNNKPGSDERKRISNKLQRFVVAQNEAVNHLSNIIFRIDHSVKDPQLPLVLLFSGPAGTGKTTCANAISGILWPADNDRTMILNMAEYTDSYSVNKLFGGPPGYSGYDEEGILSSRIKRKPYSVVLIKNIHLAHSRVLLALKSIFRKGVFSGKNGLDILASDIIFIIHADAETARGKVGFKSNDNVFVNESREIENLRNKGIPATLLNAVNHVLKFNELLEKDIRDISGMHLLRIKDIYLRKGLYVKFGKNVKEQLTGMFKDTPGEKRNMEKMTDDFIIPLIREKLLKAKGKSVKSILIG